MQTSIPATMQTVLVHATGGPLSVGETPVPRPGPGQVLIRVVASPINPSDLGFVNGSYGFQKPFPVVPGFEGSGVVVATGSGLLPRLWMNRRVSFSAATGGAWAQYLVASASASFPLTGNLSFEEGATLFVNPLTALAFIDIARQRKHAAIVSNAAASALGRMLLRLGQTYHIPIIHIVRRPEQVELLHAMGGQYILNNRAPDFDAEYKALAQQMNATLILDPVAGDDTRRLLDAAPAGSTAIVYGSLSGQKPALAPDGRVADGKRIERFFLPDWMARKNIIQVLRDMRRVQTLAAGDLGTTIQQRFPLAEVQQAIACYQANPTAGKVLLTPNPGM